MYSALAIVALTAVMSTGPVFATDLKTTKSTKTTMDTSGKMHNEVGTMKGGYSILGSKFIGMEVENTQGENPGEVKDIVIDSKGNVRYAAVSYGGFMGMGDKMYTVPMEAFTFKRDKDMFFDDVILVLNVTQDQLKDEKGFDNKNWPNLDDETYRKQLDTRYNVERSHMNN